MVFIGNIVATGTNPASNFSVGASFSLRNNLTLGPRYSLVPNAAGMLFSVGYSGALGVSGALNMAPIGPSGVGTAPQSIGTASSIAIVGPGTVQIFAVPR
jgi:hypothetical protein